MSKQYSMIVSFEAEDDQESLRIAENILNGTYDRMKVGIYHNSLINQPNDPEKTKFLFKFTDFVGNISTPAG